MCQMCRPAVEDSKAAVGIKGVRTAVTDHVPPFVVPPYTSDCGRRLRIFSPTAAPRQSHPRAFAVFLVSRQARISHYFRFPAVIELRRKISKMGGVSGEMLTSWREEY
jgi:hypothetical protein